MWTYIFLLFSLATHINANAENEEPTLYYYGMEESETSLPTCAAQQACAALLQRYWRGAALVRLCRCARRPARRHCDAPAPADRRLEFNNRAHLQFCQSVTSWPECSIGDVPLTVITSYNSMNPDDLEEWHHKNVQLEPPKITVQCRCRNPNYWKLNSTMDPDTRLYQCASLPLCKTGEFCGNVNYDLNSLYQSCLCPKHHMCVHNGGIAHTHISELLYNGKGWKAYCQRINEYSYEEY